MRIEDFDYELPESLIAQEPAPQRASSRLMVVERSSGEIRHRHFWQLPEALTADALLVLNDSRVFPARLWARNQSGARIEVLLLRPAGDDVWEVLLKPARKLRPGQRLVFEPGQLEAKLVRGGGPFTRRLRFFCQGELREWAWKLGKMPTPPYIRRAAGESEREPLDRRRYQTVYASAEGSVAAPTAGLHFTPELLRRIPHVFLTLHVGYGTFQPVRVSDVAEHRMEAERFEISAGAADQINRHRAAGGKLVAVGTTSVRVLETSWQRHGEILPGQGETDLFIYPSYRFTAVDAMITNFHLPRSTLLMLVSAFAGTALIRRCYQQAIQAGYRFYSYGDAMLIL